jgi:PASTA domain
LKATSVGARRRSSVYGSAAAAFVVVLGLVGPISLGASGAPVPRMPNLVGLSRAQTFEVMRAHKLYFDTTGVGSSDGTWQFVERQSPPAGARAPVGANAHLVVNKIVKGGPRPMPRLIGLSRSSAIAVLRANGLYYRAVGPGASNNTWSQVVSQNPSAGVIVQWLAHITLGVMTNHPRSTTTTHPSSTTSTTSSSTSTVVSTTTTSEPSSSTTTVPSSTTLPTAHAVITPYGSLPPYKRVNESFAPLARSTSGNTVLIQSLSPKICTVNRNVLSMRWPGTCVYQFQDPGNANFLPANAVTARMQVDHQAVGQATYYSYIPGYCASHYVEPFPGSPPHSYWFHRRALIKVTNLANHRFIRCRVTDHQLGGLPRVVDLSMTQFSQLIGKPGDFQAIKVYGVLNVMISW